MSSYGNCYKDPLSCKPTLVMIILGNITLMLNSLCYLGLTSMIGKSASSGDYTAGHAFALLLSVTGFVICMVVVAGAVFRIGGFDWVAKQPLLRTTFIVPSLVAVLLIGFLSQGDNPLIVQILGKKAAVWLLIPLLTAGTVILTGGLPKSSTVRR